MRPSSAPEEPPAPQHNHSTSTNTAAAATAAYGSSSGPIIHELTRSGAPADNLASQRLFPQRSPHRTPLPASLHCNLDWAGKLGIYHIIFSICDRIFFEKNSKFSTKKNYREIPLNFSSRILTNYLEFSRLFLGPFRTTVPKQSDFRRLKA
jgi:hypothetical protein